MRQRMVSVLVLGLMLACATEGIRADISIDGYSDATNDRFTNSSTFVMNGFDLSGVGQAASGRWATAISRNVIVSAAHFAPSGTITFFPGNDPTAPSVQRSILMGARVPGTDLYVAVLNANLPSSIKHYLFASESLSGPPPSGNSPFSVVDAGIYQGLNAYLFGRSPKSNDAFRDQAVGRNVVTGFSENVVFGSEPDVDSLVFTRDGSADSNFVEFEARFVSGDSGGPTFVDLNGELRLLGTNAFIYENGSFSSPGPGSGINYIGNQAAFINDFIVANAIPEPGSLAPIVVMGFAFFRHRRKKEVARS